jgi:hypothetical protein
MPSSVNPCNIHTIRGQDVQVAREQDICANPATVSYHLGFDRYVGLCLDHAKQLAHEQYGDRS